MIPNLVPTTFSDFVGKNTDDNLTKLGPEYLLVAKNVICQGDDVIKKCPGYTLVKTLGGAGKILRKFDWQRQSDKKQFLLTQRGTNLSALPQVNGAFGQEQVLSGTESADDSFDFIQNIFAAYANNGKSAYKLVDNQGVLTKYKWGIDAPVGAPTLAFSAGTLTLQFGRQYVVCFVSYITDAQGNQRMHISAPSDFTAHTGPQTSQVVTLGSIPVSADPQVTHKWVFATVDTPLNTASTFYFAAEITNATTSWGDTLTDDQLDTTRLAPWDNHPAPLGAILEMYQNRAVVIDPDTGFIQLSGFEEIDLGIPQEAFPSALFFNIPSGVPKMTGAKTVNDGNTLLVGTEEAWFKFNGYNADTFTEKDRVCGPGPVGKLAITQTPTHLCWVSRDKRIRAWDTLSTSLTGLASLPMEVSSDIGQKLAGTYSVEDLKDSELKNVELNWFMFGKSSYLMCSGNTSDQGNQALNWTQLWYVAFKGGAIASVGETDFLPSDLFSSSARVLIGSTPYILFGDYANGNIYRWPDGFTHNAKAYKPLAGGAWSNCGVEGVSRFFFADLVTDRVDSLAEFSFFAAVADAPDMTVVTPSELDLQQLPAAYGSDPQALRASMQHPGTAIGRYMRWLVEFPDDNQQATLKKVTVWSKPLFDAAP